MSSPPTTLPESEPAARAARGGSSRWVPGFGSTSIRAKLALILVIPVAAVVALSAARLADSGREADQAGLALRLTTLATDVSALAHEAHRERMTAAQYLRSPGTQGPDVYNAQVRITDDRIRAYNDRRTALGPVPGDVAERLDRIDEHLSTLNAVRQEVLSNQQVSVSEAVLRYGVVLADLIAYSQEVDEVAGDGDLADNLQALAAFAEAKAATADEQAVVYAALAAGGPLDEEQYASFIGTLTGRQEALLAFAAVASGPQSAVVNSTVTGDAVILADRTADEISRSFGQQPQITLDDAARSIGAVNDLMRYAETKLENQAIAEAEAVQAAVARRVTMESALVVITLAVAIALAIVLARSLVRSLSRLREGALAVANHELPGAVARLRDVRNLGDGGVEAITGQIRDPIRVANRDEVGQVAQAFNVVHREAVRIAAEQAALRTSVSAMFLNLARRSQALVDRMIGELDHIERTEEDPKRLAQLFQLDHLATRMRRNDENLLVLAGADSTTPRREDALLIDTIRAAQSEVELYNRIEFGTVDADISVAAHAVNDVVRLLAELLDNATRFSPPNTIVVAEARRIRDYVLVQIEDHGLGISGEQLESLNRRLAEPPAADLDVAAFRLMGLAVVSRLAVRYGIRVELRPNAEGGTVAHVSLPTGILILPRYRGRDATQQLYATVDAAATAGSRAGGYTPASDNGYAAGYPVTGGRIAPGPDSGPGADSGTGADGYGGWSDDSVPALPSGWDSTAPSQWDAPPPESASSAIPVSPQAVAQTSAVPAPTSGVPVPVSAEPASAPTSAVPAGQRGDELPIFREMEASWFSTQDDDTGAWALPTAGHPPPPAVAAVGEGDLTGSADPPSPSPMDSTAAVTAGTTGTAGGGIGQADPAAAGGIGQADAAPADLMGQAAAGPRPQPVRATAPVPRPLAASLPPELLAARHDLTEPEREFARQETAQYPVVGRDTAHQGATYRVPAAATPPAFPRPRSGPVGPGGDLPTTAAPDRSGVPGPDGPALAQPGLPGSGEAAGPVQSGAQAGERTWQTRADEGWRRAVQATEPATNGTTRSGLPKRVPQAQLVPGGVEPISGRAHSRRTPDEVRGLLSAYHRGVQRGRLAGGGQVSAEPSEMKEARG